MAPPGWGDVQLGQVALQARGPDGAAEAEHGEAVGAVGAVAGQHHHRVPAGQELSQPLCQGRRRGRGLAELGVEGVQQPPDRCGVAWAGEPCPGWPCSRHGPPAVRSW